MKTLTLIALALVGLGCVVQSPVIFATALTASLLGTYGVLTIHQKKA